MADLISRDDRNVAEQPRPCGSCSFCCKIIPVAALEKPANTWCTHFAKGVGCSIHAERPGACRDFQCLWTFAVVLDDRWRPDNCKFVMRPGPGQEFVIDVDPAHPDAWKSEPFYSQIKAWSDRSSGAYQMVMVRAGGRLMVVFPEGEVDLGPELPGRGVESGYGTNRDGKMYRYANYAPPNLPAANP